MGGEDTSDPGVGRTGRTAFQGNNSQIGKYDIPNGDYILSYWVKNGVPQVQGVSILSEYQDPTTIDGWTYFEKKIQVTSTQNDLMLHVNGLLDDLRLYPIDAQMTTYTYDPLIGITSQTDMNNITTYYEYDAFHRLKTIKDQNKDIRKRYQYQYKTASSGL